jgi:hypothetical protein
MIVETKNHRLWAQKSMVIPIKKGHEVICIHEIKLHSQKTSEHPLGYKKEQN